MKPFYGIPSPASKEAGAIASKFKLANYGLRNLHKVYWNLSPSALYEEILFRREGFIADQGPIIAYTHKTTGRSAADKFVVREATTENQVWWGEYNRPFSLDKFIFFFTRTKYSHGLNPSLLLLSACLFYCVILRPR